MTSGELWRLGPPPESEPPGGAPRIRFGMPFGGGSGIRSRRTAYRIATARRVVAALVAGVGVFAGVQVLAPPEPSGHVEAVVAARDLPAGAVLRGEDLAVVPRAAADLPSQALGEPSQALGQAVAGPVAAGEVITAVRLRGHSMLSGQAVGVVAVGVPLADATLVGDLRPGDDVSLHAAGAGTQVARGTVLSARAPDPSALTGQVPTGSVVLAVDEQEAAAIAAALAGAGAGFVLALHG